MEMNTERERKLGLYVLVGLPGLLKGRVGVVALMVQVPNNHNILTQDLYYKYSNPKPKYLTIGYMDPRGRGLCRGCL